MTLIKSCLSSNGEGVLNTLKSSELYFLGSRNHYSGLVAPMWHSVADKKRKKERIVNNRCSLK